MNRAYTHPSYFPGEDESVAKPPPYYIERPILGPCRCQGCHEVVVYCVNDRGHLGWLHANGSYRCPRPGPRRKVL